MDKTGSRWILGYPVFPLHKPTTAVTRLESDDARMHLSRTNGEMRGDGCARVFGYVSNSLKETLDAWSAKELCECALSVFMYIVFMCVVLYEMIPVFTKQNV